MSNLESWVRYGDEMRRPLLISGNFAQSSKIVIVGGGLSGLCCAYRIATKRPDLEIIIHEKSSELGGVIGTWQQDEWICDLAVNATRPHPSFWRLIRDLGLENKFKQSKSQAKARWILLNGKRQKLSWKFIFKMGPFKLLRTIKSSRDGGKSVSEVIPNKQVADAMCLGIVNDTSENVDADFLIPSVTRFGAEPPIKKSKLKKLYNSTYPIFVPKKGSIASIDGGMKTLVKCLVQSLESLDNVTLAIGQESESPISVSKSYGVPLGSILWTAPNPNQVNEHSNLSIFAIGFKKEQVTNIEIGYGTLIPDSNLPISGILHESDLHNSKRCPENHRLFRLMVPHNRWDGDEKSVLDCANNLLSKDPVLFTKIGERRIPKYKPGYMSKLIQIDDSLSYAGWNYSGVAITHVVAEAERIAELF